ncbi:unnamed protein product [marine sediment metagenome]|uniref:Uncharacterized protein n=1 Tax=marine sediment metagenome TaxID=412755 RepID=X0TJC7_9ZZZZ
MAREITYHVPQDQIEQAQRAYDKARVGLDILAKLRKSGQGRPEAEAKTKQVIENFLRWAEAFEVELEK